MINGERDLLHNPMAEVADIPLVEVGLEEGVGSEEEADIHLAEVGSEEVVAHYHMVEEEEEAKVILLEQSANLRSKRNGNFGPSKNVRPKRIRLPRRNAGEVADVKRNALPRKQNVRVRVLPKERIVHSHPLPMEREKEGKDARDRLLLMEREKEDNDVHSRLLPMEREGKDARSHLLPREIAQCIRTNQEEVRQL